VLRLSLQASQYGPKLLELVGGSEGDRCSSRHHHFDPLGSSVRREMDIPYGNGIPLDHILILARTSSLRVVGLIAI
jgi:hypothetical protein